ncbi:MAG: OmpW family protein, partial [Acinetobacter sp.]
DVRYAQLSPDVEVENVTSFDLDIDPVIYSLGYSYKF